MQQRAEYFWLGTRAVFAAVCRYLCYLAARGSAQHKIFSKSLYVNVKDFAVLRIAKLCARAAQAPCENLTSEKKASDL